MKGLPVVFVCLFVLQSGCVAREQQKVASNEPMPAMQEHQMAEHQENGQANITKHFEESLTKLTDNNLYSLELVIPEKQLKMGVNEVELIIHHGTGGDVAQAEVTVTPWMPSMGHGAMQKPKITERGGGLYSVENVVLSMTGHWQLEVKVAKDGKADTAVFDFNEVRALGHEHRMMSAPPPKDLDYSTSKTTAHGAFNISYRSINGDIRINRIHSWELKITDAKGKPVDNAKVVAVGDMPEHGHGLPTQPVITPTGHDGVYRVDGMKFQMPGWWVITLSITADDLQDSVSFNLSLL